MPRGPPKIFQILVKTHKLTVFLSLPNTATFSEVKKEVMDALLDDVAESLKVPKPTNLDEFAIAVDKGSSTFKTVDDGARLVDTVRNWDRVYIQFKDEDGELLPVTVTLPSFEDEEDETGAMNIDIPGESEVKRGKRKATS